MTECHTVRGGPKAEDLTLPDKWPEIGDKGSNRAGAFRNDRCPSTGWVRVAPGEIGEVIDTGHVMVTALFPSGLGVPWVGEREDLEVMTLRHDSKTHIMGNEMAARLRGLPAMKTAGGWASAPSMVQIFRHQRRMQAVWSGPKWWCLTVHWERGFTIGHNCESVDAVNYTDDKGCTMWVTLKPGDDKEPGNVVERETEGEAQSQLPKQYSAGWSYYPVQLQQSVRMAHPRHTPRRHQRGRRSLPNAFSRRRSWQGARLRQSDSLRAPPAGSTEPPSEVDANPSMISDAASEAYHHTFDTTEGMSEDERQRLMRRLSKQAQKGGARVLRPYLARAPEIVDWVYTRARNRTPLHFAASGGSLEVTAIMSLVPIHSAKTMMGGGL